MIVLVGLQVGGGPSLVSALDLFGEDPSGGDAVYFGGVLSSRSRWLRSIRGETGAARSCSCSISSGSAVSALVGSAGTCPCWSRFAGSRFAAWNVVAVSSIGSAVIGSW